MAKIKNLFTEEVGKGTTVSSFSKTKLAQWAKCPRKAWYLERELRPESTEQMLLGTVAHAYWAKRVADFAGIPYTPVIPAEAPADILHEGHRLANSGSLNWLLDKNEVVAVEKRVAHILPNGLRLVGIFDAVTIVEDEVLGPCIRVLEFKTAWKISHEIDEEAMIYAWLAVKEFGMPVIFTRFTGRGRDLWEQHFSPEEALSFGTALAKRLVALKKELESPELPFPKAGEHCQTCPFLDKCLEEEGDVEQEEILSVEDLYSLQIRTEAKLSQIKNRIKVAVEEGEWQGGDHYEPLVKESVSFKTVLPDERDKSNPVVGKAISKGKLIKMLAEAGTLDEFVEALDINLKDEKIREKLVNLGFGFKESVRRSIKIEPKERSQNDEEESE